MQRFGSKAKVAKYEIRRMRAANPVNILNLSNLPVQRPAPARDDRAARFTYRARNRQGRFVGSSLSTVVSTPSYGRR